VAGLNGSDCRYWSLASLKTPGPGTYDLEYLAASHAGAGLMLALIVNDNDRGGRHTVSPLSQYVHDPTAIGVSKFRNITCVAESPFLRHSNTLNGQMDTSQTLLLR